MSLNWGPRKQACPPPLLGAVQSARRSRTSSPAALRCALRTPRPVSKQRRVEVDFGQLTGKYPGILDRSGKTKTGSAHRPSLSCRTSFRIHGRYRPFSSSPALIPSTSFSSACSTSVIYRPGRRRPLFTLRVSRVVARSRQIWASSCWFSIRP